ncbi:MAG: S8 family serine peptidase, partial [Chloroflexota bacterium]
LNSLGEIIDTIINCSFCITIPPLPKEDFSGFVFTSFDKDVIALFFALIGADSPEEVLGLLDLLQFVNMMTSAHQNVTIFASVGNDSNQGVRDYDARYPARFDGVTGVVALDKVDCRAIYSNVPSNSQSYVCAFGGEVDGEYTKENCGVEGVYTAPVFPNHQCNTTGNAEWAGSSFATGRATAHLANELSCPTKNREDDDTPNDVLDNLKSDRSVRMAVGTGTGEIPKIDPDDRNIRPN